MGAIHAYFENFRDILERIEKTQALAMEQAAERICAATLSGSRLFAFGCSHAGLLALELYYRTGGMAIINPIRAPGLNLDVDPATMTSQIERLPEYGNIIVDNQPIKAGDVLIVHSVSGRNTVTVDVAARARQIGACVIALTSLETASRQKSRHPSGKRLHDVADIVIDNCGCFGDSSLELQGLPEKVAPTSTAAGAAILNAVVARAIELLIQAGAEPPVFVSANVDGGEEHNKHILEQNKSRIFYMGC